MYNWDKSFQKKFLDVIEAKYKEYCKIVPPREEKIFLGMALITNYSAVYHPLGFFQTDCSRMLKIPWKPNRRQRLIAYLYKKFGIVSYVTQGLV